MAAYFNYHSQIATSRWERRSFIHDWWRLYADDPKWAPPYYPLLRQELEPGRNSHLARLDPLFVKTEALPRRQKNSPYTWSGAIFERMVAATIVLGDSRRQDHAAYLGLLRCANEVESLERLLKYVAETLAGSGYRRVIGPTGLSPHLNSGLLQDYWDRLPPLHTAYAPPYMPETVGLVMRPLARSQLYHLNVPPPPPSVPALPAKLLPLEPLRLATDLLPLLAAACPTWANFSPPDAREAAFLLRRVKPWPLSGWLAEIDEQPPGFVLLQPDLAPRLRLAKGGRNLLWRAWLAWAGRRPVSHGRVLYGAVLPNWQGRGIGRQLLHQALQTAHQQGWQSLTFGPFPTAALGGKFLKRYGVQPGQSYMLYQYEL
ncbi:MAG: GNAT family N-acetyltransferase [Anaerolineae bacterium]|nr:GNAT family N-acetyltransferase [Anaerolineae bacterium]